MLVEFCIIRTEGSLHYLCKQGVGRMLCSGVVLSSRLHSDLGALPGSSACNHGEFGCTFGYVDVRKSCKVFGKVLKFIWMLRMPRVNALAPPCCLHHIINMSARQTHTMPWWRKGVLHEPNFLKLFWINFISGIIEIARNFYLQRWEDEGGESNIL